MKIKFTKSLRKKLKKIGFETELEGYQYINPGSKFELPCGFNGNPGNQVEMGANSYTGVNLKNYSTVKIGRFCSIGDDVKIGLNNHPIDRISTSPYFYVDNWMGGWNKDVKIEPYHDAVMSIEIGDDVFIGANVCIKSGIKIGTGAIIGCGAVVTKDVAEYSIVGGVPAQVIGERKIKENFAKNYESWGYLTIDDFSNFSYKFKRFRRRIKNKLFGRD